MLVREMIEKLKTHNPDHEVLFRDEDGLNWIHEIRYTEAKLNGSDERTPVVVLFP